MASQNIFRDYNSMNNENIISGEQAIVAEMEKLEHYGDEELQELAKKTLAQSARGQAIQRLMKERDLEFA